MIDKQTIDSLMERCSIGREIFHDLMARKVHNILLVSSLYDAYAMEQERRLSEQIYGEYHQLNLTSAPKIISVTGAEKAMEYIREHPLDMVITMLQLGAFSPLTLAENIKQVRDVPVQLLLNDNSELKYVHRWTGSRLFSDMFVWNGDAKIFLAMIKSCEDRLNVDRDTEIGNVRVILLVENSIRYISRFLPILYAKLMRQTQRLISEEVLDDTKKVLKMRVRPKVLTAGTYEDALAIFQRYKQYMLCLISDISFPKQGQEYEHAGLDLIRHIKQENPDLPTLLQSSDVENRPKAHALGAAFIDKNSQTLAQELKSFILNHLGFGDFVFRSSTDERLEQAHTIEDFIDILQRVPEDSLAYHAERNHFSAWLMARGEIRVAQRIQPQKISDFADLGELRKHLVSVFKAVNLQRLRGKVISFSEKYAHVEGAILRLADGSLGGKGRGISFVNSLVQNLSLDRYIPGMRLAVPMTFIVGAEAFNRFIEGNKLQDCITHDYAYDDIKQRFMAAALPEEVTQRLTRLLERFKQPLAVRSSGMFEDSLSQPFSGIYNTYMLANNQDHEGNLAQLATAVKLVYASAFSRSAKSYFEAVNYKIEEEQMAVIVQELVGNRYGHYFYPEISGVAQSYNFYPISYLEPEDGVVMAAAGLGKHITDGGSAFRFCARYPKLDILSVDDLIRHSQRYLLALDMAKDSPDLSAGEKATLARLPIETARKHGAITHLASVWDGQNNRFNPGTRGQGPLVLNFANLLKYNHLPLADTISLVQSLLQRAMAVAVEIEFAVNLKQKTFYVLQVKPMTTATEHIHVRREDIDKRDLLLYTRKGMGHGIIKDLRDVIYIDMERFDISRSLDMVAELAELNRTVKKYVLIGHGRWGSSDRWLGIPIRWEQISNAEVIVESGLKDLQVDASQGSHFFHNVVSMNVGYFTVEYNSGEDFIDWQWLQQQNICRRTEHFIHCCLEKPITIVMDGKQGLSMIYKHR